MPGRSLSSEREWVGCGEEKKRAEAEEGAGLERGRGPPCGGGPTLAGAGLDGGELEAAGGPPARGRGHAGGGGVGRGEFSAEAGLRRGAGPVRAVARGRVGCGDAGHELRGRRRREPGWRRAERGPAGPLVAPSTGLCLLSLRLVGCRAARCLLRSHLGSHAAPCSPRRPTA
ncbi:hypothetical protein E5288_WYG017596 [Bos mutus]|uniref:Uncharacterized protein n=1 Tax=Bos mutus TaxID=72004 RepID=A0A6B0RS89_9CETA|nr:hypothetical protein [Bos mutus]